MMNLMAMNLYGDANKFKLVTDITSRVSSSKEIRENVFLYDVYDVYDGETPEIIADKVYGDPQFHWVILLCNDIIDPVYDWVLPYDVFLEHVTETYGDDALYHVHHYEDEYGNWVDSTAPNCRAVQNIQYEEKINESKRQIRLIQSKYLNAFVDEVETKLKTQVE